MVLLIISLTSITQFSNILGWIPNGSDYPYNDSGEHPDVDSYSLGVSLSGTGGYQSPSGVNTPYGISEVNDYEVWYPSLPTYNYGSATINIIPEYVRSAKQTYGGTLTSSNTYDSYAGYTWMDDVVVSASDWQANLPTSYSAVFNGAPELIQCSGKNDVSELYWYYEYWVPEMGWVSGYELKQNRLNDGVWTGTYSNIIGGGLYLSAQGAAISTVGRVEGLVEINDRLEINRDANWNLNSITIDMGMIIKNDLDRFGLATTLDLRFQIWNYDTNSWENFVPRYYASGSSWRYQTIDSFFSPSSHQQSGECHRFTFSKAYSNTLLSKYCSGSEYIKFRLYGYGTNGLWDQEAMIDFRITEFNTKYSISRGSGSFCNSDTDFRNKLIEVNYANVDNNGNIRLANEGWDSRVNDGIRVEINNDFEAGSYITYSAYKYGWSNGASTSNVELQYHNGDGWRDLSVSSNKWHITSSDLDNDGIYDQNAYSGIRLYVRKKDGTSYSGCTGIAFSYNIVYDSILWSESTSINGYTGSFTFSQSLSRCINENWNTITFSNSPYLQDIKQDSVTLASLTYSFDSYDTNGFPRYIISAPIDISWSGNDITSSDVTYDWVTNLDDPNEGLPIIDSEEIQFNPLRKDSWMYNYDTLHLKVEAYDYNARTPIRDAWVIFMNVDTQVTESKELYFTSQTSNKYIFEEYLTNLELGKYNYWFLVRDSLGNWVSSKNTYDLTVIDNRDIDIVLSKLDTFEYQIGNGDLEFTIDYPWTEGLTFDISVDDNMWKFNVDYDMGQNGFFSYSLEEDFGDQIGIHSVRIVAKGGIETENIIENDFEVFSNAPNIVINNLPNYEYNTQDVYLDFTIFSSYTDDPPNYHKYSVYLDDSTPLRLEVSYTSGIDITDIELPSTLSTGDHKITIEASNPAGDESMVIDYFNVYSYEPEIFINDLPDYDYQTINANLDFSINSNYVSNEYKVYLDDNLFEHSIFDGNLLNHLIDISGQDVGKHNIIIWVKNPAGDEVNLEDYFNVYSYEPEIFINDLPDYEYQTINANLDFSINSNYVSNEYKVYLDDIQIDQGIFDNNLIDRLVDISGQDVGKHNITIWTKNPAGNESMIIDYYNVYSYEPEILPNDLPDYEYQCTPIYLNFSISNRYFSSEYKVYLDDIQIEHSIFDGNLLNHLVDISGQDVGKHNITIWTKNLAGDEVSLKDYFNVYSYGPEILIKPIQNYYYGDITSQIQFTIFSNYTSGTYYLYIDKIQRQYKSYINGSITTYNIGSLDLGKGMHNVSIKALNPAGDKTISSKIFYVLSHIPDIKIIYTEDYLYGDTVGTLGFKIYTLHPLDGIFNLYIDGIQYISGQSYSNDSLIIRNLPDFGDFLKGVHTISIIAINPCEDIANETTQFKIISEIPKIRIDSLPDYDYGTPNIYASFTIFTNHSYGNYKVFIDDMEIVSHNIFYDGDHKTAPIWGLSKGFHILTIYAENLCGDNITINQNFYVTSYPPIIAINELSDYAFDSIGNNIEFTIHDNFPEVYIVFIDDIIIYSGYYLNDDSIVLPINGFNKGYHLVTIWVNNSAGDYTTISSNFYVISTDIFIDFDQDSYNIIEWDKKYSISFNLSIESFIISNFSYSIMDISSNRIFIIGEIEYIDGVLGYSIQNIEPKDLPNLDDLQLRISVLDFNGDEHIFTRDVSVHYYIPNIYITWETIIDYDSNDVISNGYVEAIINFSYIGYLGYNYALELPSWLEDISYDDHFVIYRKNEIYYPDFGEFGLCFSFNEKPCDKDTLTFHIASPRLVTVEDFGEFEVGELEDGQQSASVELILSSDFSFTNIECIFSPFISIDDADKYNWVLMIYDDSQWVETDIELLFTGDSFDQTYKFFIKNMNSGDELHFKIFGTIIPSKSFNYGPLIVSGAISLVLFFGFIWCAMAKKPLMRRIPFFKSKKRYYGIGIAIAIVVFIVCFFSFSSMGLLAGTFSATESGGLSSSARLLLYSVISAIGGAIVIFPLLRNKYSLNIKEYKPPKSIMKYGSECYTIPVLIESKKITK